jgi:hypothetical protein
MFRRASQGKSAGTEKEPAMAIWRREQVHQVRYLVQVTHRPGECLWAMDELLGRGPHYQELFWWGCSVGDHVALALVQASGREDAVESLVPPIMREQATVRRLARVDLGQVRRLHDDEDLAQTG